MFQNFNTEMCEGCSVLEQQKPFHAYMDFESCEKADILFLSDSLKYFNGEIQVFSSKERDLLYEALASLEGSSKIEFAASVKCPFVTDKTINTTSRNICRQYLEETINIVQPKLVYVCGNLAMKMLIKKSGMEGKTSKIGKSYTYQSPNGHGCVVVPLHHPFSVINEPRHKYYFLQALRNGYNIHILKNVEPTKLDYEVILHVEELEKYEDLWTIQGPVAIDIETTGLDFSRDKLNTIAFSYEGGTFCIPIDHKDSPFKLENRSKVWAFVEKVFANKNSIKILHNSKFDLKFLISYGIEDFYNIADTQLMKHVVDENSPHNLKACVELYFPEELGML